MDTRGSVVLSNVWPGAGMTEAWCEGLLPLSVRACLAFDAGPTCATRESKEGRVLRELKQLSLQACEEQAAASQVAESG